MATMGTVPLPGAFLIETARLGLRRLEPGDARAIAAIFEDDEARRFYPDMHRIENAAQWIRRNVDRYDIDGLGLWAMVERDSGAVVGDCGLMLQPLGPRVEVEVGYHVRAASRGRGLATEAASACMAWGFARGLPRIISLVHPDNHASHGVAARIHRHVRRAGRHGVLHFAYFTDAP